MSCTAIHCLQFWDKNGMSRYEKNDKVLKKKYIQNLINYGTVLDTIYMDKDGNVIIGHDIVNTIVNYMNTDAYKQLDQRTKNEFENKPVMFHRFHKDIDIEKFKDSLARISE